MFGMLTLNKLILLSIFPTVIVFVGSLCHRFFFNKGNRKIIKMYIKLFMKEKKAFNIIIRSVSLIITFLSCIYVIGFAEEYNKIGYVKSDTPAQGYASDALLGSIILSILHFIMVIVLYRYFLTQDIFQNKASLKKQAMWFPFISLVGLITSFFCLYAFLHTKVYV